MGSETEWQPLVIHREYPMSAFRAIDGSGDVLDLLSHDLFEIMVSVTLDGLEWGRDGTTDDNLHYQLVMQTTNFFFHLSAPEIPEEMEP